MHHHAWLLKKNFRETESYHVTQAGLKLLTSSDLPALDSQSAEIMGVNHCTWLVFNHFELICVDGVRWASSFILSMWRYNYFSTIC